MHQLLSEDIVQVIKRHYKVVCIKYCANSEEIFISDSFKWHRKYVQGKQIV